jgi:sensor c-di-GMP phosphodiesterase-like protein
MVGPWFGTGSAVGTTTLKPVFRLQRPGEGGDIETLRVMLHCRALLELKNETCAGFEAYLRWPAIAGHLGIIARRPGSG